MIALHTFSTYPLTQIVLIPNLVSETKVQSPLDYHLNSFLGFRFKTVIDEQLKLWVAHNCDAALQLLLVGNHPHNFSLIFSSHLVHFE